MCMCMCILFLSIESDLIVATLGDVLGLLRERGSSVVHLHLVNLGLGGRVGLHDKLQAGNEVSGLEGGVRRTQPHAQFDRLIDLQPTNTPQQGLRGVTTTTFSKCDN